MFLNADFQAKDLISFNLFPNLSGQRTDGYVDIVRALPYFLIGIQMPMLLITVCFGSPRRLLLKTIVVVIVATGRFLLLILCVIRGVRMVIRHTSSTSDYLQPLSQQLWATIIYFQCQKSLFNTENFFCFFFFFFSTDVNGTSYMTSLVHNN